MKEKKDITRWNRAGLDRFEYVDGNAVTFLEMLRREMMEQFTEEDNGLKWEELYAKYPARETGSERNIRLLGQYLGERRDYAWEIMRTFSRALHVTMGHLNAYANEGYLGTATQWDNVRRLVSMLDYHPAPPASALTGLAIFAKQGSAGTVPCGWQVKNAPEDGSAPLIFETLEDIEVDYQRNELFFRDREFNTDSLTAPSGEALIETETVGKGLTAGGRGIALISDKNGIILSKHDVQITDVTPEGIRLRDLPSTESVMLYQLSCLLKPKFISSLRLYGDNAIELDRAPPLSVGAAIGWHDGASWQVAEVERVDGERIKLGGSVLPPLGAEIFSLLSAHKQSTQFDGVTGSYIILPPATHRGTPTVWDSLLEETATEDEIKTSMPIRAKVTDSSVTHAFYLPSQARPLASVVRSGIGSSPITLSGKPGKGDASGWALFRENGSFYPCFIKEVIEGEKSDAILLDTEDLNKNGHRAFDMVMGGFELVVRPKDHNVNKEFPGESVLPMEDIPPGLKKGMPIIIGCHDLAHQGEITEINTDDDPKTITIDPPLPKEKAFTRGESVLYANIVRAGHGELKPEKILGSGNAGVSRQRFVFSESRVSFVTDPEMPSGVRADIRVTVSGRIWKQKATLNHSSPTDPHYTLRMTEEGFLEIIFGDGEKGRRLPTGVNNIRISHRSGVGEKGNLPEKSLIKPVKPHPLIEGFVHPVAASGGNEMEGINSIKETAAAGLMTFDRAVSLKDFIGLAAGHSSVWQANAFREKVSFGRHESIRVVVVPANGSELTTGLMEELTGYLTASAIPGVNVAISPFEPIILHVTVNITVKYEEYVAREVKNAVEYALKYAFHLKKSKLGRAFFRSRLYEIVEGVTGVENSNCFIMKKTLNPPNKIDEKKQVVSSRSADPEKRIIKSIRPLPNQVAFIDDSSEIVINTMPYETGGA